MARSNANAAALDAIVAESRSWLGHLAVKMRTRSKTSVCLTVEGADADFIKKFAGLLEAERAAYDIAGYRDAPPGLRIWCGATVDTADIEALGPWLDWAYAISSKRLNITVALSLSKARFSTESRASTGSRLYGNFRNKIMTKPRVLISDKMDPNAAVIFRDRGCEVDVITGQTPEELIAIIGQYDGLAIRCFNQRSQKKSWPLPPI